MCALTKQWERFLLDREGRTGKIDLSMEMAEKGSCLGRETIAIYGDFRYNKS